jgi:hypothetical protein
MRSIVRARSADLRCDCPDESPTAARWTAIIGVYVPMRDEILSVIGRRCTPTLSSWSACDAPDVAEREQCGVSILLGAGRGAEEQSR